METGFQPKFSITNAITENLTIIERAQGFVEAAALSREWIQQMETRALVLEAHHTTHIEGTQLTLEQSERLWNGEDVPDVDQDDKRELLNYRQAFALVSEYLNSDAPVTEGLIREIHKELVKGVRGGQAAPGQYRKVQNHLVNAATGEVVYTPPEAFEVATPTTLPEGCPILPHGVHREDGCRRQTHSEQNTHYKISYGTEKI